MRWLIILGLIALAGPVISAPADHVILISIDGLRADLLRDLMANDLNGDYANFQRLVDEGASTFNARTDFSHTLTLPNHTCMITGRPVARPAGQPATVHHGYTANTDPQPGDTLHNRGNPALSYIASAFDVVHDRGGATAMYASKSKFVIHEWSYDDVNGAEDLILPDDGRDKIDVYYQASSGSPSNAAVMQAVLMADLAGGLPAFTFVHYRDPDSAGHAGGWGSAIWNQAVASTDGYVGELLDYLDVRPVAKARTIIILTTDHGGSGYSHTLATDARHYTIPFFVWGPGVPAGADLYALNAGRRMDPGTGRPDYNAPVAPIRNGESGNLALTLLGLPAVEGSTINAEQDLVVTAPVSTVRDTKEEPTLKLTASPNPFNARTELAYEIEEAGNIRLSIFDVSGGLVRVLDSGQKAAGYHRVVWNGRDDQDNRVSSGVYFYRLHMGPDLLTGKLALVQ